MANQKQIQEYIKCKDCIHWKNGTTTITDPTGKFWRRCAKLNVVKKDTRGCFQFWDKKKGVESEKLFGKKYKRKAK